LRLSPFSMIVFAKKDVSARQNVFFLEEDV